MESPKSDEFQKAAGHQDPFVVLAVGISDKPSPPAPLRFLQLKELSTYVVHTSVCDISSQNLYDNTIM